jgi:hypothetical protein
MVEQRGRQEQADAFEAYQVFRAAINIFFWLILFGLVVMQCAFWIMDLGWMDKIQNQMPLLYAGIKILIVICHALVIFASVIYCISMWMGLHLALVGRLNGLTNAAKAFFLALVFLIFAVPWQKIFSLNFTSVLFTYEQLYESYSTVQSKEEFLTRILYYCRFVGLWLIAMVLLIAAQRCSTQATKAINRSFARFAERGQTPPPTDSSNRL